MEDGWLFEGKRLTHRDGNDRSLNCARLVLLVLSLFKSKPVSDLANRETAAIMAKTGASAVGVENRQSYHDIAEKFYKLLQIDLLFYLFYFSLFFHPIN